MYIFLSYQIFDNEKSLVFSLGYISYHKTVHKSFMNYTHTFFFLNLVKSNQIWIVITFFGFFWHSKRNFMWCQINRKRVIMQSKFGLIYQDLEKIFSTQCASYERNFRAEKKLKLKKKSLNNCVTFKLKSLQS